MAAVAELKAVLKDTLEKRGVLGHLKARIRAEVFNALDDDREPRPPLSHENLLINELIREYLEFNKYKYTSSVLVAESGQPAVPLDRQFLIRELNAFEESKDNTIPLLYGILAHFLHGPKDGVQNALLKGSSLPGSSSNFGRKPSTRKIDAYPARNGKHGNGILYYLKISLRPWAKARSGPAGGAVAQHPPGPPPPGLPFPTRGQLPGYIERRPRQPRESDAPAWEVRRL
ncbi:PREDICTED: lisH domain-containing protein FOPNL [Elephantulus edwardii]|uniref:lisH domain-containing protein FOPNL n=1 Tax=Elephantulus edwardii TaxID=28737 RepID=UPI0003F08FD2|nr:PREDICTED: lisH domain-containing protein FOPNL [Elephantulus edwardii]